MNSDTSSDLNINFFDNANVLKKDTSETDYYLNLIANPNKTLIDQENSSSSLELSDTEKEKNSISSTSKPAFEDFKVPGYSDKETRNSSERKRSENISDVKTDSYKKKKSKDVLKKKLFR